MKRIKLTLALFPLIIILNNGFCQSDKPLPSANVVLTEIRGPIVTRLSLNFERLFLTHKNHFWALNAGVGFREDEIGLCHTLSYNIGRYPHYFELGFGGSYGRTDFGYEDAPSINYFLAPLVGYRRHATKSMLFKVFVSPFLPMKKLGAEFNMGIAVGYVF